MNCEAKHRGEHSDQPEMFKVYNFDLTRSQTECLAHAAQSEQRGKRVEIIRNI